MTFAVSAVLAASMMMPLFAERYALDVFRAPRRLTRVFGRGVLWTLLRPRTRLGAALARGGLATLARLVGASVIDDIGTFFGLVADNHFNPLETGFAGGL